MQKLLTKDAILAAPDLKTERLTVLEWGGEIIVSEMGGLTQLEFFNQVFPDTEETSSKRAIDAKFRATLVAYCVVDEKGKLVFDRDDIPMLARKNASVVNAVFEVADRLNLITDNARKAAEKNSSGEADGGEPSSPSPETSDSRPCGTSAKS